MSFEVNISCQVQILYKSICISIHTNILRKGMNLSFLHPPVGKIDGQIFLFRLAYGIWSRIRKLRVKISSVYLSKPYAGFKFPAEYSWFEFRNFLVLNSGPSKQKSSVYSAIYYLILDEEKGFELKGKHSQFRVVEPELLITFLKTITVKSRPLRSALLNLKIHIV